MDIKEIRTKINNSVGGYGFPILIGAVVLVFLSNLNTNSDSETMVAPSGYSAYPDAVTNANVIIGEVNDHTTAEIANLGDSLNENISNAKDEVLERVDTSTDTITSKVDTVNESVTKNSTTIANLNDTINKNQQAYNKIMQENTSLKTQLEKANNKVQERQNRVIDVKTKLKDERKENKSLKNQLTNIIKKTTGKSKITITGTASAGSKIKKSKASTKFK